MNPARRPGWPWWLALFALVGMVWWAARPGAPTAEASSEAATPAWVLADGSLAAADLVRTGGDEARTDDPSVCQPPLVPAGSRPELLVQALNQQLSQALRAAGEGRQQALGLWLAWAPWASPGAALGSCLGEACQPAVQQLQLDARRQARQREALRRDSVERAQAATEPAALALGLLACDRAGGADSACRLNLLTRWSELEPDNAAPWLMLAREAQWRGDALLETQALQAAAQAGSYHALGERLLGDLLAALPAEVRGATRQAWLAALSETVAALPTPLGAALLHCRQALDAEPARRPLCQSLASQMLGRARDQVDLAFAIQLAQRAGLPEARIERARQRQQVLAAQAEQLGRWVGQELACGRSGALETQLRQRAELGELAALQAPGG